MSPADLPTGGGEPEPRAAETAFGAGKGPGTDPQRLAVLLSLLLVAALAFAALRTDVFGAGPGPGEAGAFAAGCPGHGAPHVAALPVRELGELEERLAPLIPQRIARPYQDGAVSERNLWNDDVPTSLGAYARYRELAPAGFELRWWLPRRGGEDDIGADVLALGDETQARELAERASDPRCRRHGGASVASLPPGARTLFWVNGDNAAEWDVIFTRGRFLYRVVDVPPRWLVHGPRADLALPKARAELLACRLPQAECGQLARYGNLS